MRFWLKLRKFAVLFFQIGRHCLGIRRLFRYLHFPSLKVFRAFDNNEHYVCPPFLDFMDNNANITSLRTNHKLLPESYYLTERMFHKRITHLELGGSELSAKTLMAVLKTYSGLQELSFNGLLSNKASTEYAGILMDPEAVDLQTEEGDTKPLTFWVFSLPPHIKSSLASYAAPTKVRIANISQSTYNGDDGPVNALSLVNDLCRSSISHLDVGPAAKLLLRGDFPNLRILELEQFHYVPDPDSPKLPWNLSARGHLPAIFSGFSAPKLESLIVHGKGALNADDLRPFVASGVEILVTGQNRGMIGYENVRWAGYM